MPDKKVRIDEYVQKKVQEFRKKSHENRLRYPSDKHFVHVAILELLDEEDKR